MKNRWLFLAFLLALIFVLGGCFLFDKANPYNFSIDSATNAYTYRAIRATVTLTDPSGQPLQGVKLIAKSNDGKLLFELNPETESATELILETDENGKASFQFFSKAEGKHDLVVHLSNQPCCQERSSISFEPTPWLFLFWLCGDNNLESYALGDIEEIKAGSGNSAATVALVDLKAYPDNLLMCNGEGSFFKESLSREANTGSATELASFFDFFANGDYANIALVIWNHGNAWFDESSESAMPAGSSILRGVAYDDSPDDFLKLSEINSALLPFLTLTPSGKIDLLGFDACIMGSVEVAYELRDIAHYMIASARTIPSDGWDYDFLGDIQPDSDTTDVARTIIDRYASYYAEKPSFSLSLWDLKQLDSLYLAIDQLSKAVLENTWALNAARTSKETSYYFYNHIIGSLGDFLSRLESGTPTELSGKITVTKDALAKAVPVFSTKPFESLPGCGIFLPSASLVLERYREDYQALSFSENTWSFVIETLSSDSIH